MDNLKIKNLGPVKDADISFGDLTLFVGPQASGKSIVLQLLKLITDKSAIRNTLIENNYEWGKSPHHIVEVYFGENTANVFSNKSAITFNGREFDWTKLPTVRKSEPAEKLFYIPAQRVISISQGWPKAFSTYDIGDPYVIKQFSETLRVFLDRTINLKGERLFPGPNKLEPFIKAFDKSIFHGGEIISDTSSLKKRFLLKIGNSELPFMTWSAGQKGFMPLLLSFYYLFPQSSAQTLPYKWVVIEEPEMGLHPLAIQSIMQFFLGLLYNGYKLIISSHSTVLLELSWTMKYIQEYNGKASDLANLFGTESSMYLTRVYNHAINKKFQTYYFNQQETGVYIKDISSLDAANKDEAISNWGGLSDFSTRANEIVAKLVA
jgi:AAA15 family ATPase/GTPase